MKTEIVAVALAAGIANAGISYQSQNRYVRTSAHLFTGSYQELQNASGFQDFDTELISNFSDIEGGASSSAEQHSSLQEFSIIAYGACTGSEGPPAGSSSASGTSHVEVSFMLDQAADFSLQLSGSGLGDYSFTGGSLDLSGFLAGGFNIQDSGVLDAGSYTFVIDFVVDSAFGNGSFNFDFQVAPAPASASLIGLGLLAATRRRR